MTFQIFQQAGIPAEIYPEKIADPADKGKGYLMNIEISAPGKIHRLGGPDMDSGKISGQISRLGNHIGQLKMLAQQAGHVVGDGIFRFHGLLRENAFFLWNKAALLHPINRQRKID